MASFTRYSTKEDTSEEGELESEDDGDSGGESFLADEEEFVPDEDFDDYQQDDEEPSTSSGGQGGSPPGEKSITSAAGQDASPPAEEPSTLPAGKDASPPAEEPSTSPAGEHVRAAAEDTTTSAAGQDASLYVSTEREQPPQHGRARRRTRRRSPSPPHSRAQGSRSKRARRLSSGWTKTTSGSPRKPKPVYSATSWKTEEDPDVCPEQRRFVPARPPGHKLNPDKTYTPMDLFKLFFSNEAALTICHHTNKQAAKNIAKGKKYSWTNITMEEFFRYVGLTFFIALVKLSTIRDYWKKNTIFSVPFPANIMVRDRYQVISWNIHMSDPEEDVENDRKKGTPDHDRLFRLKPLLDTIKNACLAYYHPRQNLAIDERMVATKAHTGMTQHMKAKPIKWGFKLFVLADSSNGYTVDFTVYTGKSQFVSGVGLAYDSVMSLMNKEYLGSGFHLYVDNFYTSPKLFKDLFNLNVGACGTYRGNRKDVPHTELNVLKKNAPRGSIRWIREGPLVFVKWMDTREVSICSTIHPAFSGNTVKRRVKTRGGDWTTKCFPCPTPIRDYNKHMGGVDMSDQLIQYYSVHHKSMRWYRTLFFHFLDIAATNSYLLHKELCREKQEEPMSHRDFLQELTAQLCGVTVKTPPAQTRSSHVPVAIAKILDVSRKASYGRRPCVNCRQTRKAKQATPWKCKECDVALCVISDRNCFEAWHS
ncbi:piggyBac transposable element-derived protein 4-like [Perca fluviatilis]|uniref:piggyBac transposable element-derived protein 4-like n=1 Tax=Perca fluviatilis TaxID=8168 RepID=UPI0019626E30|nr:piggyBac transposable element-derived protein 4-like [Perca fluviatilis]